MKSFDILGLEDHLRPGPCLPLPVGLSVARARSSAPAGTPTVTWGSYSARGCPVLAQSDFWEVLSEVCLPMASAFWVQFCSLDPQGTSEGSLRVGFFTCEAGTGVPALHQGAELSGGPVGSSPALLGLTGASVLGKG